MYVYAKEIVYMFVVDERHFYNLSLRVSARRRLDFNIFSFGQNKNMF